VTCRCLNCKRDFYTEATQQGLTDEVSKDENTIYDENALREAEEELRRQADDEGDHRY